MIRSLKKSLLAPIVLLLIAGGALELVLVPLDPVVASPPNIPEPITCPGSQIANHVSIACTFTASYYRGAGSFTYCFLGEGALFLKGAYYPLTQPGASPARELGNAYCPSMHR